MVTVSLVIILVVISSADTILSLPISQNINSLSVTELNQYRDCVRLGLTDGRYAEIAGEHGVPMGLCPHGNLQFLPWHRHHLAAWETRMNCTIPYWDWAHDPIPMAFLEDTYTDLQGRTWPNPLKLGLRPHSTHRDRSIAIQYPTSDLRIGQELALSRSDLPSFSSALEDAHNLVHVSIGGDMSDIDYASYDPIFYSHHKNVDRIWFLWQTSPARNSSSASASAASAALANDFVNTAAGVISSLQIANDLSAWISLPNNIKQGVTNQSTSAAATPGATPSTTTGASTTPIPPTSSPSSSSSSSSGLGQSVLPSLNGTGGVTGTTPSTSSNPASTTASPLPSTSNGNNPTGQLPLGLSPNTNAGAGSVSSPGGSLSNNAVSGAVPAGSSSMNGAMGSNMPSSTANNPLSTSLPSTGMSTNNAAAVGAGVPLGSPSMNGVMGPVSSPSSAMNSAGSLPISSSTGSILSGNPNMRSTSSGPISTNSGMEMLTREPRQHIVLSIPEVKSTTEGYRLNVILDGECIGRMGLLGMGRMTSMKAMSYKKDRLVDVTCHLETVNNLASVKERIQFELLNDQDKMIARPRLNFTLAYQYF